jgi:thioredoxin reductase (NADPH)
MEEAAYLTKFASTVHIIHRRDALRASKTMQDRVLSEDNVQMHWNSQVVDVVGEDFITGLVLEDTVTGDRSELPVSGLFVAIGHSPATAFLQESGIEFDDSGYVALPDGGSSETNLTGVFAAGDVADHVYRQAITAAGMGCRAAMDAERWLAGH